jgi:hypothetical protein
MPRASRCVRPYLPCVSLAAAPPQVFTTCIPCIAPPTAGEEAAALALAASIQSTLAAGVSANGSAAVAVAAAAQQLLASPAVDGTSVTRTSRGVAWQTSGGLRLRATLPLAGQRGGGGGGGSGVASVDALKGISGGDSGSNAIASALTDGLRRRLHGTDPNPRKPYVHGPPYVPPEAALASDSAPVDAPGAVVDESASITGPLLAPALQMASPLQAPDNAGGRVRKVVGKP